METEFETFERVKEEVDKKHYHSIPTFEYAKLYRIERNKQLIPSDKERLRICKEWTDKTVYPDAEPFSFLQGFKKAIELLTNNK